MVLNYDCIYKQIVPRVKNNRLVQAKSSGDLSQKDTVQNIKRTVSHQQFCVCVLKTVKYDTK